MSTAIWLPLPDLDGAVQGGSGDLERPAYLRNGMALLIESTGNTKLLDGEGFWPAADSPSGSGSSQASSGSFPDEVSLKLR